MIKIFVLLIGLYLFFISSAYQGMYGGYIHGSQLCEFVYPKFGEHQYVTHADPYFDLINIHLFINWFLLLFIVGRFLTKKILSQIISLPSALLVFYAFIRIYYTKLSYTTDEEKYFDLMRAIFQSDFIHIWLALALVIYQIITAIQSYLEWKRNSIKVE